ncbi:MAG TPA: TauD/TfdA family dioxygenase [Candidatus Sulfotelmatobacter sp.]|nr:TauD/TfdA family dioxygenase [Candidatus Sulfotelmatobacter sp.]
MSLELRPLHPLFVAEASGIDLRRPLNAAEVGEIERAMNEHAVLVFRGQPLSQADQVRFAESFGPLDIGLRKLYGGGKGGPHRLDFDTLLDISNVEVDGSLSRRDSRKNMSNLANQLWHSDSSFQRPKAQYSMLSAVVVPSWGGETEFADLRAAYDALPGDLRRDITGLEAEHYALHSRIMLGDAGYSEAQMAAIPPVCWPLAQVHPGSRRRLLFVGVHARRIIDYPLAEGRVLLSDLLEHATQRQFVYRHEWQVGDLVMWDNRCTVHRGRRYDLAERRELRRTTTDDLLPVQMAAA